MLVFIYLFIKTYLDFYNSSVFPLSYTLSPNLCFPIFCHDNLLTISISSWVLSKISTGVNFYNIGIPQKSSFLAMQLVQDIVSF